MRVDRTLIGLSLLHLTHRGFFPLGISFAPSDFFSLSRGLTNILKRNRGFPYSQFSLVNEE